MSSSTLFIYDSSKTLDWRHEVAEFGFHGKNSEFEDASGKETNSIQAAIQQSSCDIVIISPDVKLPHTLAQTKEKHIYCLLYSHQELHDVRKRFIPGIRGVIDAKDLIHLQSIIAKIRAGEYFTTPITLLPKNSKIYFNEISQIDTIGTSIDRILNSIDAKHFSNLKRIANIRTAFTNLIHQALILGEKGLRNVLTFIGVSNEKIILLLEFTADIYCENFSEDFHHGNSNYETNLLTSLPSFCDQVYLESIPALSRLRIMVCFQTKESRQAPTIITRNCSPTTFESLSEPNYYDYIHLNRAPIEKVDLQKLGIVLSGNEREYQSEKNIKSTQVLNEKLELAKKDLTEARKTITRKEVEMGKLKHEVEVLQKQLKLTKHNAK